MKTDRHGQAKILTPNEIQRLFETGFTCDRDRALFGICLYTACRINEACTLLTTDVYDANGVRARLTIRKGNKASAPSKARLCQPGEETGTESLGQASGIECCVGSGNADGEAYTER